MVGLVKKFRLADQDCYNLNITLGIIKEVILGLTVLLNRKFNDRKFILMNGCQSHESSSNTFIITRIKHYVIGCITRKILLI